MATPTIGTSNSGGKRIKPTTYEKALGSILWRGINFPYSALQTNIEQQLVLHEYPDRDGAHVESTGRRPIEVSCTAIFYNHISPGIGESWTPGDLFPNVYNEFIVACTDNTIGNFVHPTLGLFTAKCRGTRTTIDASARGGAKVEVSWVETINVEGKSAKTPPSAAAAASDMNELSNVVLLMPPKDPRKLSILGFLDAITGAIALVQLGIKQLVANVDRALYHIQNLLNAINSFDDNIMALIKRTANNLKSTLINLKKTSTNLVVKLFKVTNPLTVAALATQLGVTVDALCQSNPSLARHPIVPAGTPIVVPK